MIYFILALVILGSLVLQWTLRSRTRLVFTLFTKYKILHGMKKQIKKSQFVDDGNGNLLVTGKVDPLNAAGGQVSIDGTPAYGTSDEAVALIGATGDRTFAIKWVGAGTVKLTGVGKSMSGKAVPGALDLVLVDDTVPPVDTEAVDLNMSLDVATEDVPE